MINRCRSLLKQVVREERSLWINSLMNRTILKSSVEQSSIMYSEMVFIKLHKTNTIHLTYCNNGFIKEQHRTEYVHRESLPRTLHPLVNQPFFHAWYVFVSRCRRRGMNKRQGRVKERRTTRWRGSFTRGPVDLDEKFEGRSLCALSLCGMIVARSYVKQNYQRYDD